MSDMYAWSVWVLSIFSACLTGLYFCLVCLFCLVSLSGLLRSYALGQFCQFGLFKPHVGVQSFLVIFVVFLGKVRTYLVTSVLYYTSNLHPTKFGMTPQNLV